MNTQSLIKVRAIGRKMFFSRYSAPVLPPSESLDGFVYLLGSELHRLRQTFSKLIALQLFAELLGHNTVDIL